MWRGKYDVRSVCVRFQMSFTYLDLINFLCLSLLLWLLLLFKYFEMTFYGHKRMHHQQLHEIPNYIPNWFDQNEREPKKKLFAFMVNCITLSNSNERRFNNLMNGSFFNQSLWLPKALVIIRLVVEVFSLRIENDTFGHFNRASYCFWKHNGFFVQNWIVNKLYVTETHTH